MVKYLMFMVIVEASTFNGLGVQDTLLESVRPKINKNTVLFTHTNNIRKFNLIIKIERSSDLNALFLFI